MRNVILAACLVGGLGLGLAISQWRSQRDVSGGTALETAASATELESARFSSKPELGAPPFGVPMPPDPAPSDTVAGWPAPGVAAEHEIAIAPAAAPAGAEYLDLAALLEVFPVIAYERGEGAITGVVLAEDGQPVPDVEVVAIVWGTTPGVPYVSELDQTLIQYIRSEIDQYHYDIAMMTRARTDAAGAFTLGGIRPDRDYHLQAKQEGWFIPLHEVQHVTAGADVALTAIPTAPVTVLVQGADVESWGGHVITSQDDDSGAARFQLVWKSEAPTIQVPTTATSLYLVTQNGHVSKNETVDLRPGQPVTVTLELQIRPRIRGQVRTADGSPLLGSMWVSCIALAPGERALTADQVMERRGSQHLADLEGQSVNTFGFTNLEPGRYQVSLHSDHPDLVDAQQVTLTDGSVDVELVAPAPDRSRFVMVHAFGPEGTLARGVTCRLTLHFDEWGYWSSDSYREVTPGVYWVLMPDDPDPRLQFASDSEVVPPRLVSMDLVCTSPEYGTMQQSVAPGPAPQAVVQFAAAALIDVQVEGADDWRLGNRLELTLYNAAGHEVQLLGMRRQVQLGPVAPGRHEVALNLRLDGRNQFQLARQEVTVTSGATQARLRCSPLYRVVIQMPLERAGGQVYLHNRVAVERQSSDNTHEVSPLQLALRVDGRGQVVAPFLPAGTYRVDEMSFEVTGHETFTYSVKHADALEVSIEDEEGALARWGLADGDLIVAIDGVAIQGTEPVALRRAVFSLARKGSRALTVLRGGHEVEIQAQNAEGLDPFDGLGGELEPAYR